MATTPYDEVLYPSHVYTETHPSHLAAIARLFGHAAPEVATCRVLDIGCGDASNVIPMAVGLPRASFVGFDLAERPIEAARRRIAALGLGNVQVEARNLLELPPELGAFDYIIAHGFLSWVPPEVQRELFAVCERHLTPNGVAFISYNAQPAGHQGTAVREMMRFHLGRQGQTGDAVKTATDFLARMAELVDPGEATALWKQTLAGEVRRVQARHPRALHHDDLGPFYVPYSLADFAAAAGEHGLVYLADASLRDSIAPPVKAEALEAIDRMAAGDRIARQQYLDFLTCRGFHRSLICRAGATVEAQPAEAAMGGLFVASPLAETPGGMEGATAFRNSRGAGQITTNDGALVAALRRLAKVWPRGEMVAALDEELETAGRASLRKALLRLAANKLVDLRGHALDLPAGVSARPVASPLARMQAQEGALVATMLQTQVELKEASARKLLTLLDGTRGMAELAREMKQSADAIEPVLQAFHRMGLLVA